MKYLKAVFFYSIAIIFVWFPFFMWIKDNELGLKREFKIWFDTAFELSGFKVKNDSRTSPQNPRSSPRGSAIP